MPEKRLVAVCAFSRIRCAADNDRAHRGRVDKKSGNLYDHVIPMRSHGGGWHANTAKVCFGLSIIYYLTVVFVSERLPDTFDNLRFMALISAIIILLSPVDSINKPLDGEQRKIEKKKTCRYVVAIYCISLILKWNSLTCYVKEINFSLFIVLCSMIFGIVSNTKSNRKQDV